LKTVLVVDDEIEVLEVIQFALELRGYNVICANSESEALKLLENNSVDALITDFYMPHGNGLELIRRARQMSEKPLRCLLVSGLTDFPADVLEEVGWNGIVRKPFHLDQLVDRIG
jgi:CheY-like chemotaxis protein